MPRENSKCRQWQKQRRNRLKEAFDALAKVLPNFEPSINICQIDILRQATTAIQELQDEVKKVVTTPSTGEKCPKDDILKKLHERVRRLLSRNQQLTELLQDAGIKIPKFVGSVGVLKNFTRAYRWKNKISPEQAKLLAKAEMEKENITDSQNSGKTKKPKTTVSRQIKKTNRAITKRRNGNRKSANCLYVLPQPVTVRANMSSSCYLLSNTVPGTISKIPTNGTAPYPCKNNPYQKQTNEFNSNPMLPMPGLPRNNIQHPEVSPSMNSGGTSLTNFNLSAIFPEINKATATNLYPDNRTKEQSNSTGAQVPFNVEPKYTFSS